MKNAESGNEWRPKIPNEPGSPCGLYCVCVFVSSIRLDLAHADEPVLAVSSGCSGRASHAHFPWIVSNGVPAHGPPGFVLRHRRRAECLQCGCWAGGHESLDVRRILAIPLHALPERTPHQGRSPLVLCSFCLALLHTPATCFGG
jgi:hypothetical protein